MSIYHYSGGSVIDEVTFVKSDGGSLRAYLHALPNTSEKTLNDISLAIAKRGWQIAPHTLDGKATLEVRGLDRNAQVNGVLFDNGWVKGKADITADKKDNSKIWDKLKKRSLFLSGVSFIISDTCFTIYGKQDKSPFNIAAGLSYMAGGIASFLFARKDTSDLQVKEIAGKMAKYMAEQNIEVPDNCSLKSISEDKDKGIIKTSDDFFRRYPSETMNVLFGVAGACVAAAALKNRVFANPSAKAIEEMLDKNRISFKNLAPNLSEKGYEKMAENEVRKHMKTSGWLDVGLGSMTMASATFGNLVEEKSHDPDTARKHGVAGIWEWIQERPLAITGVGYLVSTGFHTLSTIKEYKDGDSAGRKAVKWRASFIAWTIIGEVLLALSSKGHGKGVVSDKSVDESVISLAAELIAKQPVAQQSHLIDYMSGFLGREDVLAKKDDEVKDLLRTQVELIKKNPWARCKENLPDVAPAPENKIFIPPTNKKDWQATVKSPTQESSPAFSI